MIDKNLKQIHDKFGKHVFAQFATLHVGNSERKREVGITRCSCGLWSQTDKPYIEPRLYWFLEQEHNAGRFSIGSDISEILESCMDTINNRELRNLTDLRVTRYTRPRFCKHQSINRDTMDKDDVRLCPDCGMPIIFTDINPLTYMVLMRHVSNTHWVREGYRKACSLMPEQDVINYYASRILNNDYAANDIERGA